jgi:hypothetical protein
MNKRPIEQANDSDLRNSRIAMLRALQRTHDVAKTTSTTIVISHNGVIEHRTPNPASTVLTTQIPPSVIDKQA